MMSSAKYVIVDGSAVVFSPALIHSKMVPFGSKVDGAGFVRFEVQTDEYGDNIVVATVWGHSESLGVSSNEWDATIITCQLCKNM